MEQEQTIDNSLIDRIQDDIAPADIDPMEPSPEPDKLPPGAEPEVTDPTKGIPEGGEATPDDTKEGD